MDFRQGNNPDATKTPETADHIDHMEIPQDSKPDAAIEGSKPVETANEINPVETSLENEPDEGGTLETASVIGPMEIHVDNKPEEPKALEFPLDGNANDVSEEAETLEARDQISSGWEILDTKEDGEESVEIAEAKATKKDAAQSDGGVKDAMERVAG
ncbi:uncharacterized protein A4U43_C02F11570 [Asparagus officinalis]|uniref:Uncharacterized protein n=1 Tax=Asparagus officinalis TaxID=4686 RepID=A0A5P1FJH2_ASPOF|nr:uncharacterized protein A4U43_C02F11570 [Asparagus officinalis]